MRILFINEVCGTGSTGKICAELAQQYEKNGYEAKIAYGRHAYVPEQFQKYAVRIGSDTDVNLHAIKTRLTDKHGFGSRLATKKFLKWAEEYAPDVLWLHNLHGYYINIELLFQWIKKHPEMEVKWTLHDCWAFTGHCSHFTFVKCYQWKTRCEACPQKNRYPSAYISNSKYNFDKKRALFCGIRNMTIITPSNWLADLVKQSFLNEYPVEVVYNEFDKTIFKPTESDFRDRYHLEGKKIVLGVASVWDDRKGLYDFYKLSEMLSEDYAIVLVGLNDKQLAELPKNIIGIKRTNGQKELAEIYSAADIFVNPSREETFGLTTVEAIACGTPAIVYKGTACEEIVNNQSGLGYCVDQNVSQVYEKILALL